MKRLLIALAVGLFTVSVGAHGSGYWGPDVQTEIIRQQFEAGNMPVDKLSDKDALYFAKRLGAPAWTLKTAERCRNWLASLKKYYVK
jgi:hypothetical protein